MKQISIYFCTSCETSLGETDKKLKPHECENCGDEGCIITVSPFRLLSELPNNGIDLSLLAILLNYSDRYEISVQFWPKQTAVFIAKDGVDLIDYGGDFNFAVTNAIEYLNRINNKNETE